MKSIAHILFPINFNNIQQSLIDYATQFISKENNTQITFLSIEKDLSDEDETKRNALINELTANYSNQVNEKIHWLSKSGGVKDTILLTSKELNVDLIMMGTRGSEHPNDFTLASEVVLDANCSVLVIPENIENTKIEKIALSVGNDEIKDHKSLLTLFEVARLFNAEVHVLTVQGESERDKEAQQKNDSLLDYYLENLFARHSFSMSSDIEQGIFDYVKNFSIDMLVIMPNNHAVKGVKTGGKLTKVLTLHTQVPLLTIN